MNVRCGVDVRFPEYPGGPVRRGTVERMPTDRSPYVKVMVGRREFFTTPSEVIQVIELPDTRDMNAVTEWLDA